MRNVDIEKGSKYQPTIELTTKKDINPIVAIALSAGIIILTAASWWAFNHIANGCTSVPDLLAYCAGK